MAHEMYGINDLLKQYPLVEKAFEKTESEIEAAVFFTGGEKAVVETPKRIIETVVNNIDGTDAEKQALIIGAMYALSPESLAGDKGTFESEYGPETEAVMDSLLTCDQTAAVMPASVAQIGAVLSICIQTNMISSMTKEEGDDSDSFPSLPQEMAQALKTQMLSEEKRLLSNIHAPKLEALFQKTTQEFIARIDVPIADPQKSAQRHQKSGGPQR